MLSLGLDCCCEGVCDICNDANGGPTIRFFLTPTGITTQTNVVIPENPLSCIACEDRNTAYELTYMDGGLVFVLLGIVAARCPDVLADWDGVTEPCAWYISTLCGVNSVFQWSLSFYIIFYRTAGGDLRSHTGYLAQWTDTGDVCPGEPSGEQSGYVDALEAAGSFKIDCLTYSKSDTFNVCAGSTMPICGCTAPTGFTIVGAAA
jgi:hypothetical protein